MYNAQMPYYPVAMGYPDYMYQQYPFYAMAANQFATPQPYMNHNGMNGYVPNNNRKKHTKGNNGYNNYYNNGHAKQTTQWSSHMNSQSQTPETSSSPQAPEAEITKVEEPVPEQNEEQIEEQTIEPQPEPEVTEEEDEEPKEDELPLLFNTSLKEFTEERTQSVVEKRGLLASKSIRLNEFLQNHSAEDHVINPHCVSLIIDHNTDNQYYKRIYQDASDSTNASNNDDDNESKTTQTALAVNWASVLQSTATKKAAKKTTTSKTAPVTAAVTKQATPPALLSEEAPQSMGLLVMKMLFDPEFDLDCCASFPLKPRGLTNTGNICYMNAVLQCLLYCEPFNKLLRLIDDKSIGSLGKSSTPIIDATITFAKDFMNVVNTSKANGSVVNSDGIVVGRPLSPESLYTKLIESAKFQHLKWGQQEDAEEFLGYLLDGLHEEFVKVEAGLSCEQVDELIQEYLERLDPGLLSEFRANVKNAARVVKSSESKHVDEEETDLEDEGSGWSEVGSGKRISKKRVVTVEPSPITQIFGGRFRSVLTIPKAKESQSITVDPFRCMLVDISHGEVGSIADAFWRFNEVEKIPFKLEPGKEVIARKQSFIDQLPEVLVLQLKRFSYQHDRSVAGNGDALDNKDKTEERGMGTIEKVMKDVRYGLELTVPAECLSPALRGAEVNRNYRLIGVIYHHGRNAEGGHYTCDILRSHSERTWLRIDDTAVEAVDAEAVVEKPEARDKSAYILMYQRSK